MVAPDQRGYGTTDRPDGIDQHSIFHLVGDVVALIREFGEEQAVVEQCFGAGFYQNYFQDPGVADADLGRDVAATLRLTYGAVRSPEPSHGFLGRFAEPETLPSWLTEEDLAIFVDQFRPPAASPVA